MANIQAILLAVALLSCNGDDGLQIQRSRRIRKERRKLARTFMNFSPDKDVQDQARIDLDSREITNALRQNTKEGLAKAYKVYTEGAFSGVNSVLTLQNKLSISIAKGKAVYGMDGNQKNLEAKVFEEAPVGATTIEVEYLSSKDCHVRGVAALTRGCFFENGTITLGSPIEAIVDYSYDKTEDTYNSRTIQGFSTDAVDKMYKCDEGCPFEDYEKYYNYYGEFDYANRWIVAAFENAKTTFTNGNADFTAYSFVGMQEVIRVAATQMNIWMYIIREMEHALAMCVAKCAGDCDDDHAFPVSSWDEAVAFFFGSLQNGNANSGYLPYSYANGICRKFGTCGTLIFAQAKANLDVMDEFIGGQYNLNNGDCEAATLNKKKVVALMTVPLIQGVFLSAYNVDVLGQDDEMERATGAVSAAAVLPMIHHCNEIDATTIYNNMKVNGDKINFKQVKSALENNYDCLGITCDDIGGLLNSDRSKDNEFLDGAEACGIEVEAPSASPQIEASVGEKKPVSIEFAIGLSVGCVLFAAVMLAIYEYLFGVKWY